LVEEEAYIVILMHPAWLQNGQSNFVMTVFRTSFTTFFEDLRFPILPVAEWFLAHRSK